MQMICTDADCRRIVALEADGKTISDHWLPDGTLCPASGKLKHPPEEAGGSYRP